MKKAYADIILNTAKETAARIMSSEKKVAHYQYELQATKEEALRMLLRIKQLRDSKVNQWFLKLFILSLLIGFSFTCNKLWVRRDFFPVF